MNSDSSESNIFTWKTIGHELGILGLLLCSLDIASQFVTNKIVPYELFFAALNVLMCGLWLCGIVKHKTVCMLISLVFWGIQMAVIFTIIILIRFVTPNEYSNFGLLTIYGAIVFVLAFFALGVITFRKIREEINRPAMPKLTIIPRWNVTITQQQPRIRVKKYIHLLDDEHCDKV